MKEGMNSSNYLSSSIFPLCFALCREFFVFWQFLPFDKVVQNFFKSEIRNENQ